MTNRYKNIKFDIFATIKGNQLVASIENIINDNKNIGSFGYFLIKNEIVIDRQYSKESKHTWELTSSGVYVIQGYVFTTSSQPTFKRSKPIEFFTRDFELEYNCFIEKNKTNPGNNSIKNTPLYSSEYPYCDIVCIITKNRLSNTTLNSIKHNLNLTLYDEVNHDKSSIYIFSNHPPLKLTNNETLYFSGVLYTDNSIHYGIEEISFIDRSITDGTGSFACIKIENNNIDIFTDFFGFNRFFYFTSQEIFIVSNRYHYLLESTLSLNIELELYHEKIIAQLSNFKSQMFLQNFSNKMDIKKTYQLQKSKNIQIRNGDLAFVNNGYAKVFKNTCKYDYDEMIIRGINEIKSNIKNLISYIDNGEILCDLTGGLDSRVVYAAITRINNKKDLIKINSDNTNNSDDLDIAIEINNIYNYSFNDIPAIKYTLCPYESDLMMRSVYMGTYFCHNPIRYKTTYNKKTIRMSGACGEILLRPYISRNFFDTYIATSCTSNQFVHNILTYLSPQFSLGGKAFNYIKDIFLEEIGEQEGSSNFEKLDRHYLSFRHGYHFDGTISYTYNGTGFMPLQSKSLFKIHHSTYNEMKDIKLQFDVTFKLNKLLAIHRYDDQRDDNETKDIIKKYHYEFYNKSNIIKYKNTKSYSNATERKKASLMVIDSNEKHKWKNHQAHNDKLLLSYFYYFSTYNNNLFGDIAGLPLYYAITNSSSKTKRVIYNKITSIVDQILIVERSKGNRKLPHQVDNRL